MEEDSRTEGGMKGGKGREKKSASLATEQQAGQPVKCWRMGVLLVFFSLNLCNLWQFQKCV